MKYKQERKMEIELMTIRIKQLAFEALEQISEEGAQVMKAKDFVDYAVVQLAWQEKKKESK